MYIVYITWLVLWRDRWLDGVASRQNATSRLALTKSKRRSILRVMQGKHLISSLNSIIILIFL
jgi:hypothetical protein